MPEPRISAGAFRRRLALALVLTVGLLTAGLHAAAYALVRENLLQDSLDRWMPHARFAFDLAGEKLPPEPTNGDLAALLEDFESRTRFDAVLIYGGDEHVSSSALSLEQVPEAVRAQVRDRDPEPAHGRVELGSTPHLVFGSYLAEEDADLYLFFSQQRVWDNIGSIRRVLILSWVGVVVLTALLASLFARSILQPVGRASAAARSLAEGLLDTRLPVEGSDELGVWAQSFNEMADALQGKIQALRAAHDRERRFTADVSHELKTPLTALTSAASVLAGQVNDLPPEARRTAEILIADVRRMRGLVEELIEISRLDAGQESVVVELFDPAARASALVSARGWGAEVRIDSALPLIGSDPRRFDRIVGNLVENALEHGAPPVDVRIRAVEEAVVLEVGDRGAGVDPQHLTKLFDRFYKIDESRSRGGSGLGLAIVRENVRLLDGDVSVTSTSRGTTFRVTMPNARVEEGVPAS